MRILLATVVFLGSLLGTLSAPVFAQEVLTNQSIVEMVKAGLSERVIVAKIRTSPTNFDVRTDALIALKKNGVPEKVIEVILAPSSPPTASAAAPSPPPSAAPPGGVAMVPPAGNPARGRPTVYQIVGGKEVELMAAGTELQKNRMRYGRTSELVLPGNKAKYRTADRQPVFVITSAPNEMPLVRLEPGGDDRNLKIGSGSRVPFGGGSTQRQGIRGEDMIDVDAEQDSRGFYRIRPRAALAPGEYGFVSTRGGGAVGSSVYDFGVD
jgi:hypothetical protein